MGDFSHLSKSGKASMVDVGGKKVTARTATVRGSVRVSATCAAAITPRIAEEINTTARIAAIQGSKQTANLIPLCHQVPLSKVEIDVHFESGKSTFSIRSVTSTEAQTGVEMEAFTAATIAGLTIYDMIKAVDPAASVGPFYLEHKTGGRHGPWSKPDE